MIFVEYAILMRQLRLRSNSQHCEDNENPPGDGEDDEDLLTPLELDSFEEHTTFVRIACMAHSLQLVIKKAYTHYDGLLAKARHLVSKIRKSSCAMEKQNEKCGKVLITDNSTRWNSTYHMVLRLIELKPVVNDLLSDMKTDSLLVSEWERCSNDKQTSSRPSEFVKNHTCCC